MRKHAESARGLQTDLRTAQSPLKKGRSGTHHLRDRGSCESAEVTRAASGIHASGRAGENAGAELLEGSVDVGKHPRSR